MSKADGDNCQGETLAHRDAGWAILAAFFVVFDIAVVILDLRASTFIIGLVLGVIFAQATLAGVWTAFAPVGLFVRGSLGFLAAAFAAASLAALVLQDAGGGGIWSSLWFGAVLAHWAVIQLPLWGLRLAYGCHLGRADEASGSDDRKSRQFGIGQLLAWTTLVAAALGVARWLIPKETSEFGREAVFAFGVILTCNSLLAWPVIWAALMRHRTPLWLVGVFAYCFVLTFGELAVLTAKLGTRAQASGWFWTLNLTHVIAAVTGLVLMRISGFQLRRRATTSL